jgi:hypothetical protein
VVVLSLFLWFKLMFSEGGGGSFMNTVINVLFLKRRPFCTQLNGCHLFKKMLADVEMKFLVAHCLNCFPLVKRSRTSLCVTSLCDIQVK